MSTRVRLVEDQKATLDIIAVDADGAAAAPDEVKVVTLAPDTTATTYTLSGSSELTEVEADRRWRCVFPIDQDGTWCVRAETLNSGAEVVGAHEATFTVTDSCI